MAWFLLLAALMLAAALAFVLPPLLREPRNAGMRGKLKALADAHAAGILSDAEYAAKRATLGAQQLDEVSAPAVRRRSTRLATLAIAHNAPQTERGCRRSMKYDVSPSRRSATGAG